MNKVGMCACGGQYCEFCNGQSVYWPRPFEHVTTTGTGIRVTQVAAQPSGWICPRCNTVHAPSVASCACKS